MMKFKKAYNSKIIALIISTVFLSANTLYSYPVSKDSLRVPIHQRYERPNELFQREYHQTLTSNRTAVALIGPSSFEQPAYGETYALSVLSGSLQYHLGDNIKIDSYDMYADHSLTIDGNDVLEVFKNTSSLIRYIRKGKGPAFLECLTYRFRGHSIRDAQKYRSKEEVKKFEKNCPIKRYKKYLIESNTISKTKIEELEIEIQNDINKAVKFAQESPILNENEVEEDVYA